MVEELEKVFGDQAEGPLAGVVRFVPIERLNAVLVISPRSLYVDRARTWIDRLDVGENETPRLYVYYCENSRAEDLAGVLSQVFGQQQGAAAAADGRTGSRPVAGDPGSQSQRPTLPAAAPRPLTAARADAGAAARRPGGATAGGGSPAAAAAAMAACRSAAAATSSASSPTRSRTRWSILAKPSDYRTVESALQRLDIVPLQVLIEATILEVTLNDTLRYGVEWFFKFGGSSKVAFSSDDRSGASAQPRQCVANAVFPGFSYILSPTDSVKAVVNALDQVSDVNVISSPQVFVLDNQTATLTVGDQVPITTRRWRRRSPAPPPTLRRPATASNTGHRRHPQRHAAGQRRRPGDDGDLSGGE